ncbi:MAG: FGGY-family carbohydrate kinase [Pseudomonadota bacterium]
MTGLSLGLDLGTSGLRSAVVDADGRVLSQARADYPGDASRDAEVWWAGAVSCLQAQVTAMRDAGLDPLAIKHVAVDGTSGSLVLVDADLRPVTRALMYSDGGFAAEASRIAEHAPDPHITRGPSSALARLLRLQAEAEPGAARYLLHQADFIAAQLASIGGVSDHNNALKMGFDPDVEDWPSWFDAAGVDVGLLPSVQPAGSQIAFLRSQLAAELGLSPQVVVHAGTTDSIAAFLASAPMQLGAAVTSLGTTLAIKILSAERVDAPEIGLYSHRLGPFWLVGGASNTGGGVLRQFFTPEEIAALSKRIDPKTPSAFDYYPLPKPGERFPINDPELAPRLSPRPKDDALFLGGLLEGIARIEAQCYAAVRDRGGPDPTEIFTAGGGAQNRVFTAIRERVLGRSISVAGSSEAAIGAARLANIAVSQTGE